MRRMLEATTWRETDRAETARLQRFTESGVLRRFLSGERVLYIGDPPQADAAGPFLPRDIMAGWTMPAAAHADPRFADGSWDVVVSHHVLEHSSDYRRDIANWFRIVRDGGFLMIVVPQQFLFERKLSLPSRFDKTHRRYYTAASLLLEIEEAIDPFSYRVRHLEDNDAGFDEKLLPEMRAKGCCEVVVVLEKVRRPDYADAVMADIPPASKSSHTPILRSVGAASGSTVQIRSEHGQVDSVAVIKLDHRGDFILARPAMMELRRRFPQSRLTLVCGTWNAAEAANLAIFDDILTFDFYTEAGQSSETRQTKIERFARLMNGKRFDLAVDLRVDPDTRDLLQHIDAGQRAGFSGMRSLPFLDIEVPFTNPTALKHWQMIKAGQFTGATDADDKPGAAHATGPTLSLLKKPLLPRHSLPFEAGAYEVELMLSSRAGRFRVDVEVRSSSGPERRVHERDRCTVRHDGSVRFVFQIDEPDTIEFQVTSRSPLLTPPYTFKGLRWARRGLWYGPHQQELMYMLACVVGLRMQNPYKVDEVDRCDPA